MSCRTSTDSCVGTLIGFIAGMIFGALLLAVIIRDFRRDSEVAEIAACYEKCGSVDLEIRDGKCWCRKPIEVPDGR
jgi:hypothetical protein